MDPRCIFCQIIRGRARATILVRLDHGIVIEPLNPHAPGHCMVIPKWHLRDATQSPALFSRVMRDVSEFGRTHLGSHNIITSVGAPATQSVFHLHVHLIPRGEQDGLPARWPWIAGLAPTSGHALE